MTPLTVDLTPLLSSDAGLWIARALRAAVPGDTLVVASDTQRELGEIARARLGKHGVHIVVQPTGPDGIR